MYKKILAPLDGTGVSDGIVAPLCQIALATRASVVLLTVVDGAADDLSSKLIRGEPHIEGVVSATYPSVSTMTYRTSGPTNAPATYEQAASKAKDNLMAVAGRLRELGVEVEAEIVVGGRPAEQILEVARKHGCDMIAMATHGRGLVGRSIWGSVTDKVIHASMLPVLTVKTATGRVNRPESGALTGVMVPLDGTPLAERALPHAEQLAAALGVHLTLIMVLKLGPVAGANSEVPGLASTPLELELEISAHEYLKKVADRIERAGGPRVRWKVLRGLPAQAIADEALEMSEDLVVMTSQARNGVARFVLGSVADAVIRGSGGPVLVTPSNNDEG